MVDSTFFKGLAVLFAFFLVGGGVAGFAFLSANRAPPPMDDLHLSNDDGVNRLVRVEVVPTNGSDAVFAERVELGPDERVSFDGTTESGESYRLVVAVGDREPASFEIEGPDGLCTIDVRVENATAEAGMMCA